MKTFLLLSMVYGYKGQLHTGNIVTITFQGSAQRQVTPHTPYSDQLNDMVNDLAERLKAEILNDPRNVTEAIPYLGIISHAATTLIEL